MSEIHIEKQFGNIVRLLRQKKRFTQENFAGHLGIDRSYQGKIERGETSVTIRLIQITAKGLEIPISELFKLIEQKGIEVKKK